MSARTRTVVIGLAGLAAVAIAIVLINRTTSDSSSTTTASASQAELWAHGTCAALSTWRADVTKATDSLKANRTREGATQAVADLKTATRTFVSSVGSLGPPSTSSGKEAQAALKTLESQLREGVSKVTDAASSVSGVSGSMQSVATISSTLVTMRDQVTATAEALRELPQGELQQAFTTSSSCTTLQSSTSHS
jgi:hypothetical protein